MEPSPVVVGQARYWEGCGGEYHARDVPFSVAAIFIEK